jgi:tetratricopeptide (TPR) repeat protein
LAAGAIPPAQLPAAGGLFTGRSAQLRELDELLDRRDIPTQVGIATLAGTAGIGKTALAVHWANQVRDQFPDGQLYVDLRGYAAEPPLRPIDALARLLQTLGVPAQRIPADVEQAAALYRSLLAGMRVLVLLDNAREADQVRPLLPGSPGCFVLVTSRDRLGGLVARDGAVQLTIGVLAPAEARGLLTRLLGIQRVHAEPDVIGELAELCDRLPLALRIAAAHLSTHPGMRADQLVTRLRTGNRLDTLAIEGDSQVAIRTAFDLSYAGLPTDDRCLFRLLGLSPGDDIALPAAAELAGRTADVTVRGLDRLCGAHLVEERMPGRYGLHDLLRLYSAERAAAEDDSASRDAARRRLFDHYLRTADSAASLLYANKVRLPLPAQGLRRRPAETRFSNQATAVRWLDAERQNLSAVVRHAARHGPYDIAWLLSDALRGYFFARRDTVDWPILAHAGLRSAEAHGDPQARASARLSLGVMHWIHGDYDQALVDTEAALALARKANWHRGESSALGNLGSVRRELGQLSQAADCLAEALRIDRRIGWRAGEAAKLGNLGLLSFLLGRLGQAAGRLRQGIALQRKESDRSGEAVSLVILAEICHAQGHLDQAGAALDEACMLNRQVGTHGNQIAADLIRALVLRDTGELEAAFDLATAAVERSRDTGESMHEADGLNILAAIHSDRGQPRLAIQTHQQALHTARRISASYTETETLIGLAWVHLEAAHPARAAESALAALGIARRASYRMLEGQALTALAAVHRSQAQHEEATRHAGSALAIHTETGHRPGAERTRAMLQITDATRRAGAR